MSLGVIRQRVFCLFKPVRFHELSQQADPRHLSEVFAVLYIHLWLIACLDLYCDRARTIENWHVTCQPSQHDNTRLRHLTVSVVDYKITRTP